MAKFYPAGDRTLSKTMTNLTLIIGNKNYSSWSLRPWLAMQQAGIEFEVVRIPLDTPETRQKILQYSPA